MVERKVERMKTYRRHNCKRQHRNYPTLAKCIFPRAAWVDGAGRYASLAWCGILTVKLFNSIAEAEKMKTVMDCSGCGGDCKRDHEIVRLVLEAG